MRLDFLMIASVPYDLIIDALTLEAMRACIHMYDQTVKIRNHGETEVLNLVYELETWDGSDDELTSESESDIGEDSDKGHYSAFVLALNKDQVPIAEAEEINVTDEKSTHLREEYAANIKWLTQSYPEVIVPSFDDVKPPKFKVTHKFESISEEPISQRLRRLPPTYNEIVKKEVYRMLQEGTITPDESAWTSPSVLATKKDDSQRFCIDFRNLNAVMKSDKWPVPFVEEIFDELKGSSIFTTLDLFQRYWQFKMDEIFKDKTTFIFKFGMYLLEVMLFGLKNSGATFQRITDNTLLNVSNVKSYVYGVVVHSATEESLENVFALLLKHQLRIRLKKCSFMQPRVELMGHCIEKESIHTDERKAQTIRDAHPPRSREVLRSFLGIASYYRRFIKNFVNIVRPLSKMTSEKTEFDWTLPLQKSFDTLKQALTTAPVLACPDFSEPFLMATGAFSAADRAVFLQLDENG